MIVPMSRGHVAAVVEVHQQSFPSFFLTFLGPRFLRLLYTSIVESPQGVGFVYAEGGQVLGFVAGVANPSGFYSSLIRRRLPAFMMAACTAALRRPSIIARLFRALTYPSQTPAGNSSATLMSIGTRPDCQGRGVGKLLVEAFLGEMRGRGVRSVNLTTDRDNNDAINLFYRKLGFSWVRSYTTPENRAMNEYEHVFPEGGGPVS